jgi:hypothetical protein
MDATKAIPNSITLAPRSGMRNGTRGPRIEEWHAAFGRPGGSRDEICARNRRRSMARREDRVR